MLIPWILYSFVSLSKYEMECTINYLRTKENNEN